MGKDIRIIIAQRGWVFVGEYAREGEHVTLSNAKNVHRWGTTKGLGQLAQEGPQSATKLNEAGTVEIHNLAEVANIRCNPEKWSATFGA